MCANDRANIHQQDVLEAKAFFRFFFQESSTFGIIRMADDEDIVVNIFIDEVLLCGVDEVFDELALAFDLVIGDDRAVTLEEKYGLEVKDRSQCCGNGADTTCFLEA